MDIIYEKFLRVQSHEINCHGVVRLPEMFTHFQNIATEHGAHSGVPITTLIENNLTWVVARYHVMISRYPSWREHIRIKTWRSGVRMLIANREFEVVDESDCPLMVATASFMLLDLLTRRAVAPGDYFPVYPAMDQRVIRESYRPVAKMETPEYAVSLRVRRHDLDLNSHVNNARYIEWALESIPDDVFHDYYPSNIEVSFRGEALFGDTVSSRCQQVHGEAERSFLHSIVRESDGRELTRLKTVWALPCQMMNGDSGSGAS